MRYICVPDPIILMANGKPLEDSSGEKEKPWTFSDYLERIVLADPAMGTGYKDLKACFAVDKEFKGVSPGTFVEVEGEHWEKLRNTIENPKGGGISPGILRQLIPFMDAIVEAKDKKSE